MCRKWQHGGWKEGKLATRGPEQATRRLEVATQRLQVSIRGPQVAAWEAQVLALCCPRGPEMLLARGISASGSEEVDSREIVVLLQSNDGF